MRVSRWGLSFVGLIVSYRISFVYPFAARQSRQTKKNTGGLAHKGFGKAPPTLQETLATFKTREPPLPHDDIPCPCGQIPGRKYVDCCGPYHSGAKAPKSPLEVLRTRYSAFCWRNIGYIIQTTHPTCRDYRENRAAWAKDLDKCGMFDSYDFIGLSVLGDHEEYTNENEGYVEFEVRLRATAATEKIEGQIRRVKERSKFLRDPETKVWSYAGGEVSTQVNTAEDIVLNK